MRQRVYDVLVRRPGAREGRLRPEGSTRAGFEAAVEAASLAARSGSMNAATTSPAGSWCAVDLCPPCKDLGPRFAGDDDAVRAHEPGAPPRGDGEDRACVEANAGTTI